MYSAILLWWMFYTFAHGLGLPLRRLSHAKSGSAGSSLRAASSNDALFSFGLCADIQYVEAPDDFNFQKTKVRRYMQSLRILKKAVESWEAIEPAFVILLGDIIDGKAKTMKNEEKCLEDVLSVTRNLTKAEFVFGNHEHYCFNREDLHQKVLKGRADCSKEKLYYSFSPVVNGAPLKGWKFICLDAYDKSLIGASSDLHLQQAKDLLKEMNPNDLTKSGGWFDNLSKENYRYVPYNGGLSDSQLQWFTSELQASEEAGERVVIFCHQPIHAPGKPQSLLWNAEDVKEIIHTHGARAVVCWMAGHDHDGQYSVEKLGTSGEIMHHLVPPAPIECSEEEPAAYGHMEVYSDRLKLQWTGRTPAEKDKIEWPDDLPFSFP